MFSSSCRNDNSSSGRESFFERARDLLRFFNILLPIIDYTNYAILGITCALAYELPSKPLSELQDELIKTLHHKGSHELLHNNNNNDSPSHETIDKHHYQKHIQDKYSDLIYLHPSEYLDQNSYGKKNVYKNYIPGPYSANYYQSKPIYYSSNTHQNLKNSKFDSGNQFESFWNPIYQKSPYIRRQDVIPKTHQHAVYHIMGRRSIDDNKFSKVTETTSWLNKLDQIHLQYHRSSRHALYSKLEEMFDKQGKNGTECVLRALCETGNRSHETEPGEVVTEVLRAVFTLPKDSQMNYNNFHPVHKARDDAHWNQKNCSQAYPLCENFIWDGNFRI
ncbi:uncharacterized protein LOC129915056 [Episyrphus balteatus]|uniref:uncharacterized protein LOC129915056 n=1 Tax=Episyrphus balteatus TaxID=286459 RepID=UPI002484FABF|nr:uncharacterized protein LOC129915056 [Episyrphus balteatus]